MRAGIMLRIAMAMAVAGLAPAVVPQASPIRPAAAAAEQRIDINHASLEELLKVPGMTPSWAGRIVRFRPYRTKQDLLDKGIVSGEVYNRIKDSIIAHREPPR
jgi:competence protein ComEA